MELAPTPGTLTTIGMRLSMDLNVHGRAAAKMALNLACHALGPTLFLHSSFDDLRAYILGDFVDTGPAIGESGEQGWRQDMRFLREPWWLPGPRSERGSVTSHCVSVGVAEGELFGDVLLYGGTIDFRVRLGRVGTPDCGLTILVKEFEKQEDEIFVVPLERLRGDTS